MGKLNITDIIGKKFGNMIVLKLLEDKGWNSVYLLKCSRCGSEYKSKRQKIINKYIKHSFCVNCKDRRRLDIVVGETIGNYTVLDELPNDEYRCKCKCGYESTQTRRNLLNIKLLEKKNPNAYKGPTCPHHKYRLNKEGHYGALKEGEVYKNLTTIGKLKENLPGLRPHTKYYIFKCNKCGKLVYNQKDKLPKTCAHRHLFTKDTFKKGEWYIYPQFKDLLKDDEVISETESINEIKKENNMNPLVKYVLDNNKTVIEEKLVDIMTNDPLVMNMLCSKANNFIGAKIENVTMGTDIDNLIKELISSKDFKEAVFDSDTFISNSSSQLSKKNIDTEERAPNLVFNQQPPTVVKPSFDKLSKDINILKGYREMLKGINLLFTAKGIVPLSKNDLITFIKNDSIAEDVITYALNSGDILLGGKVYRTTDSMIANALYAVEKRIKELGN